MNEKEYIIYKINSQKVGDPTAVPYYFVGTVSGIPILDGGHYQWASRKDSAKRMSWDEASDMINRLKACYCVDKWEYYLSKVDLRVSYVDYESYYNGDPSRKKWLGAFDDPASSNALKTSIKDVIFNNPATIVFWDDGTKTVVKRDPDEEYDAEKGLAMCIAKRALGNKGNYYNEFRKWLPKEGK